MFNLSTLIVLRSAAHSVFIPDSSADKFCRLDSQPCTEHNHETGAVNSSAPPGTHWCRVLLLAGRTWCAAVSIRIQRFTFSLDQLCPGRYRHSQVPQDHGNDDR